MLTFTFRRYHKFRWRLLGLCSPLWSRRPERHFTIVWLKPFKLPKKFSWDKINLRDCNLMSYSTLKRHYKRKTPTLFLEIFEFIMRFFCLGRTKHTYYTLYWLPNVLVSKPPSSPERIEVGRKWNGGPQRLPWVRDPLPFSNEGFDGYSVSTVKVKRTPEFKMEFLSKIGK